MAAVRDKMEQALRLALEPVASAYSGVSRVLPQILNQAAVEGLGSGCYLKITGQQRITRGLRRYTLIVDCSARTYGTDVSINQMVEDVEATLIGASFLAEEPIESISDSWEGEVIPDNWGQRLVFEIPMVYPADADCLELSLPSGAIIAPPDPIPPAGLVDPVERYGTATKLDYWATADELTFDDPDNPTRVVGVNERTGATGADLILHPNETDPTGPTWVPINSDIGSRPSLSFENEEPGPLRTASTIATITRPVIVWVGTRRSGGDRYLHFGTGASNAYLTDGFAADDFQIRGEGAGLNYSFPFGLEDRWAIHAIRTTNDGTSKVWLEGGSPVAEGNTGTDFLVDAITLAGDYGFNFQFRSDSDFGRLTLFEEGFSLAEMNEYCQSLANHYALAWTDAVES